MSPYLGEETSIKGKKNSFLQNRLLGRRVCCTLKKIRDDKMSALREVFERLYERNSSDPAETFFFFR